MEKHTIRQNNLTALNYAQEIKLSENKVIDYEQKNTVLGFLNCQRDAILQPINGKI